MLDELIPSDDFRARFARFERPPRLAEAPWFASRMDELERIRAPKDQPNALQRLREAAAMFARHSSFLTNSSRSFVFTESRMD